jgi:asparagine synthase (glutamine-hydrolysing)
VKVILSGEGGDEFFAGYNRYRNAARQKFSLGALLGRGVSQGSATPSDAGWLRDALCDASLNTHIFSAMQLAQLRDIADWLPHDLLLKLDRCLMAHGIEGRTPFVDKIVSSFAFGLPDALKFEGRLGKILLRRWLSRNCPAATAFGRKRGFRVPVHDWMSRQAERIGPLVARQRGVARLYDAAEVLALFERSRPETYLRRWNLLFFAAWHQHHFRGVSGARDVFEHLSAA